MRDQEPPGGWDRPLAEPAPEGAPRRSLWWAAGAAVGVVLLAVWLALVALVILAVVLLSKAL